jgi:hypothetical protein
MNSAANRTHAASLAPTPALPASQGRGAKASQGKAAPEPAVRVFHPALWRRHRALGTGHWALGTGHWAPALALPRTAPKATTGVRPVRRLEPLPCAAGEGLGRGRVRSGETASLRRPRAALGHPLRTGLQRPLKRRRHLPRHRPWTPSRDPIAPTGNAGTTRSSQSPTPASSHHSYGQSYGCACSNRARSAGSSALPGSSSAANCSASRARWSSPAPNRSLAKPSRLRASR